MLNRRLEIHSNDEAGPTIERWVKAEINDCGLLCTTESKLDFELPAGSKAKAECMLSFTGLAPDTSTQLEFAWRDNQGWVRTPLRSEPPPELESKFLHRLEMSRIDDQNGNLILSIVYIEGMFWNNQNPQFGRLVATEPLVGLFEAWRSNRQSMPVGTNYALKFREQPPATGIWRSRPRYEFEKQLVWKIHVVSDFRPGEDLELMETPKTRVRIKRSEEKRPEILSVID